MQMSKVLRCVVLLSLTCTSAFDFANAQSSSRMKPAYASENPITEPRLFGEGVISTPDDELNATFSADGNTIYFSKNVPGRLGVLVESHFVNGQWTKPIVLPFSGQYNDYDPCLSADGKKMYFCSNRPLPGKERRNYDLYVVERTANGWGEPQNLGPVVNADGDEFYPSVSNDGTLIFSANRPGGKGNFDIYMSTWAGGKYSEPVNLGDSINVATGEIDNYLAPDKSYIIFAGYNRPDSYGNGDLYISQWKDSTWTKARNLGPKINSNQREYCPIVTPDGKYFFWTSFRSFADKPLEKPITYDELLKELRGTLNGNGNIYQIDISELGIQ
ncbi:MAG: hypothetical protein L0Y80_05185 [Ignavibacteriae bacterium]|nr:hypothetical protein [Ignavibacteriota bacterium]